MKRFLLIVTVLAVSSVCVFGLSGESRLFSLAETRYFAGNYILALETYNEFISTYPLSDLVPDAQFRRAVCFYRLARYDESLELLKRIETSYRSTRYLDYISFWAGLIFYAKKDYSRAGASFGLFLEKVKTGDKTALALLHRGLSAIYLKNNAEAESSFLRLLDGKKNNLFEVTDGLLSSGVVLLAYTYLREERFNDILALDAAYADMKFPDKDREKILYYKAEAFWGLDRTAEAKAIYSELVSAQPETALAAYRRLFILAQKENNQAEAERLLSAIETAFSSRPEMISDFWYQSGIERYRKGDTELAEFFLSRVWNLRDKKIVKPDVPRYLAEVYIKQKKYEAAADVIRTYIKTIEQPGTEFIQRLGDIFLMKNDFIQAAVYYRKALGQNSDTARAKEISYYLACALYRQGQTEEALGIVTEQLRDYSGGAYHPEFLRLMVLALKKLNRIPDAIAALQRTIAMYPGNQRAYIDLVKLYFSRRDYDSVIKTIDGLDANIPSLREKDPYSWFLSRYFSGLSLIVRKEYEKASVVLSLVAGNETGQAGLSLIVPYALFYRAWATYRLGDFREAAARFSLIVTNYPKHDLRANALYFTGWCWYSAGEFGNAVNSFSMLADEKPDDETTAKALFFKAKSLLNLKKTAEARDVLSGIFTSARKTSYADDALFEFAHILAGDNKTDEAVKAYQRLIDSYPDSPLKEESSYLRAELYFQTGSYAKARDAFYQYRAMFPKGSLYDAALYWGGLSSYSLNEKYAAALLWEIIIESYPSSTFRPVALKKTAEIYTEKGEYAKARSLYAELISAYPREASAANARETVDKLNLLILGIGEKEAELLITIEQKKGADTPDGRKALLELARLYLYDQDAGKRGRAYNILVGLVKHREDRATAAQAQFLTGEYFFLEGDFIRAGNEFLNAALLNPDDKDLMAASIYKAAEMMKRAKKTKEVRDLVQRLEKNFPQSGWVLEGKRLLEGLE